MFIAGLQQLTLSVKTCVLMATLALTIPKLLAIAGYLLTEKIGKRIWRFDWLKTKP